MAQVLNEKIEPLVSYWKEEVKLHPNIDVQLRTYVDAATVKALNPDEVIVAPGGEVLGVDVPGIDGGKNVVSLQDIKDMVAGVVPEGKRPYSAAVAAIASGTVVSCMGLKMASGPTAIVGKRVVVVVVAVSPALRLPNLWLMVVRSLSSKKPKNGQRHWHYRQEPH